MKVGYLSSRNLRWIALAASLASLGAAPESEPRKQPSAPESFGPKPTLPCAPEATRAIEGLVGQIAPMFDTVRRYAPVREVEPGFRPDGTYVTRHGIVIEAGCFRDYGDGRSRDDLVRIFNNTDRDLFERVDRCGRNRLLSTAEILFRDTIGRGVRFSCNFGECRGDNAAACRINRTRRLNLNERDSLNQSGLWFHEILHVPETVDNQTNEAHNVHSDASDLVDEVVFWQRHCFAPHVILNLMRSDQPNACSAALGHHPLGPRPRYSTQEIRLMCQMYERYLGQERVYHQGVFRDLLPEVLDCTPHLDGIPCPDVAALNRKLAQGGPLARMQLPTRANLTAWLRDRCPTVTERDPTDAGKCIKQYATGLRRAIDVETIALSPDLLTPDEEMAIERYTDLLVAKAEVLGAAAGTRWLPEQAQARNAAGAAEPSRRCMANEKLRGSTICRMYETSYRRPMASLLRFWW
jgi:hypothetical protein